MTITAEPTTRTLETYGRRFGVELEFKAAVSIDTVSTAMSGAGIPHHNARGWCSSVNNTEWHLKTDSTCGLELTSKVLEGGEGVAEVAEVVEKLDDLRQEDATLGINVTRQCGVHVHIDVSEFGVKEMKKLIRLVIKYEEVIYGMNPASRRGGGWCKPIARSHTMRELLTSNSRARWTRLIGMAERYLGMNLKHWPMRGTVEFRYAAGTLSAQKVTAWIMFLMALVEKAKSSRAIYVKDTDWKFHKLRSQAVFLLNGLKKFRVLGGMVEGAKRTLNARFKKFSAERINDTIRVESA